MDMEWYYNFYLKNGLNPYVDVNQENMLTWLDLNKDLMISKINETLVLQYTNSLNDNAINTIPLSKKLDDQIIETIFLQLRKLNLPLELHEVPSIICNELSDAIWDIEDDRNSFEYLLCTTQQALLPGREFKHQRRHINAFNQEHKNDKIEIKFHNMVDQNIKDLFIQHIESKSLNKKAESSENNKLEPIIIKKNLEYASLFNKKALTIKINDKYASFAILSHLDNNTVALNHLKVDYSVDNIFTYSINALACILRDMGISKINIEQDLGIQGLRTFKERLQPICYLEKKIIKPKVL